MAALCEVARSVAADLGFALGEGGTGGASDGNFTAALSRALLRFQEQLGVPAVQLTDEGTTHRKIAHGRHTVLVAPASADLPFSQLIAQRSMPICHKL